MDCSTEESAAAERGRVSTQRLAGTDDRGLVNRLIRHAQGLIIA
jgi:hypothetical protein